MAVWSSVSRRKVCKGLGLMAVAMVLGGCAGLRKILPLEPVESPSIPADQFDARIGTLEEARVKSLSHPDFLEEYLVDFVLNSPRFQEANASGLIESVFYNPRPAVIRTAVRLQLMRGKDQPEHVHNDLDRIAARQYQLIGQQVFANIYPSAAALIGDPFYENHALLQLIITGELPSKRIVLTNADLESLLGRKLTLAHLLVHGIQYGPEMPSITFANIMTVAEGKHGLPEGSVSTALLSRVIRLEVAEHEVRMITPADPAAAAQGWQAVSTGYRNFAVGQFMECEKAVADYAPRTALEKMLVTEALRVNRPFLVESLRRVRWNAASLEEYRIQKQESRSDLLAHPIFLPLDQ
jgi:hypothetical protein